MIEKAAPVPPAKALHSPPKHDLAAIEVARQLNGLAGLDFAQLALKLASTNIASRGTSTISCAPALMRWPTARFGWSQRR
jgi:hypothetical protein